VCTFIEGDEKETKLVHEEKPVALLPGVKTELKEEPLTLEGEPHGLLSVKREIKEEAVPMTKAETTSAQPTAGMSSHSITVRRGKLNSQFIVTDFLILHAGGWSLFRFQTSTEYEKH
jgi:hypothetical protein